MLNFAQLVFKGDSLTLGFVKKRVHCWLLFEHLCCLYLNTLDSKVLCHIW